MGTCASAMVSAGHTGHINSLSISCAFSSNESGSLDLQASNVIIENTTENKTRILSFLIVVYLGVEKICIIHFRLPIRLPAALSQ